MMRIILASGSPRRKELLEQIGLEFEVKVSSVEEEYDSEKPEEIVKELALIKALDIAQGSEEDYIEGDCIVIGADTIVVKDDKVLGKPNTQEEAFLMLKSLQGASHMVYTGVAIIECREGVDEEDGGVGFTFDITNHAIGTKVYVMPMTDEEITKYIATGEPMDKAGAYGIQGRFSAYVEGIEGDYFNVMGLPVSYVNAVVQDILKRK
ncbi:MAG: Maf family protein [Eubacteriales bacterium]